LSTEPTTLTADTTSALPTNRFFLFERLLSFLDQDSELNSVLSGYFSKLLLILIQSKQKEVYNYVYIHHQVFENLVKHLYSKSISEILQKLLANTPSIYHSEDTANNDQ
jgi:serine/threonine-protein phosphatase 6 regulatory subunit 3